MNIWLERSGTTILKPGDMVWKVYDYNGNLLASGSLDGYDTESDTTYDSSLKSNGVYTNIEWDPEEGINSGEMYSIEAEINYRNNTYKTVTSFVKTSTDEIVSAVEEMSQEVSQMTEEVSGVSEGVETAATAATTAAAAATAAQVSSEEAKEAAIEAKIAAEEAETKTSEVLTATEETIPEKIEEVKKEAELVRTAEILNREKAVMLGDTVIIRYRTYSGLSPVIDVYDPENNKIISSAPMSEVGSTGVYEYPVTFYKEWGTGDFTIICSEATYGTMDAMVITVLRTDIEQVESEVAAVLGTTAGLEDLSEVADTLDSQISMIEQSLGKIGEDLVTKVKKAIKAAMNLKPVYAQLVVVSEMVKELMGAQEVNLEKIYEVSKEKMNDIIYLKNKTQELKAAVEVSRKLLENIANKPIVQIWYEFR